MKPAIHTYFVNVLTVYMIILSDIRLAFRILSGQSQLNLIPFHSADFVPFQVNRSLVGARHTDVDNVVYITAFVEGYVCYLVVVRCELAVCCFNL